MLKDFLTKNLDLVFCGTAKEEASVLKEFYHAGSGNKFYGILYISGFPLSKLEPKDCFPLVKNTKTPSANRLSTYK